MRAELLGSLQCVRVGWVWANLHLIQAVEAHPNDLLVHSSQLATYNAPDVGRVHIFIYDAPALSCHA